MTLIDYAKYLLSVCGRRFTHLYRRHYLDSTPALPSLSALLSYLKTQTASIYGYLQTRFAGDPTSGIPSITPTQPLTFANLLTNIEKLKNRKIDAGTNNFKDGISLLNLLCNATEAHAITTIDDPNRGYTINNNSVIDNIYALLPNISTLTIGAGLIIKSEGSGILNNKTVLQHFTCYAQEVRGTLLYGNFPNLVDASFPNLQYINSNNVRGFLADSENSTNHYGLVSISFPELLEASNILGYNGNGWWGPNGDGFPSVTTILLPKLQRINNNSTAFITSGAPSLTSLSMPALTTLDGCLHGGSVLRNLEELRMPSLTKMNRPLTHTYYPSSTGLSKLILLEVGALTTNADFRYWSPTLTDTNRATFLFNFRKFLFLNIVDRTATTALTLTLSSAVFKAVNGYNDNDQTDPTSFAETHTLADLGVTELTAKEQSIGSITLQTKYSRWFRTYRDAIHWNTNKA